MYEPSGVVARVENTFTEFIDDISTIEYGNVENLPEEQHENIYYIVSALVLNATCNRRADVVSPASGHPECKRNSEG